MSESSVDKLKRLQAEVAEAWSSDTVHIEAGAKPRRLHQFLRFWALVIKGFWTNRCQVRAAALAYTTLLALVPLLAVSLSVASLVFDVKSRDKLTHRIEEVVSSVAPTLGLNDAGGEAQRADVANKILEFADRIHFGTIGVTAMAGLIFVAISLLRTVEQAFNDIWSVTRGRGWFDSIVLYWAAITLGPIVLLVATTSGYLNALQTPAAWLQAIPGIGILRTSLLPLLLLTSLFGGLYKLMPNTRVGWQAALIGGVVAALLWWGNNKLGALYNTRVLTYSKIYGSLGAVPLFLAGMYLSWTILLLGAQTAYTYQFRSAYLQDRQAERIHQQGREFIGLRFMTEIGRRFALKEAPIPAAKLAEQFGVPNKLSSQILATLAQAKLLNELHGLEPAFVPGQPLAQISVANVLRALRASQGHELATPDDATRAVVRAEFDAVLAAEDARAGSVTIEDLIRRATGK